MTLKELISHPIWLKVFSERHYIFVFYDKTGNFVFTKNEYTFVSNQYYSELLRKSTIFDCFDVPRVDDLNCFFSGEKIAQSNFVLESDGGNFDSLPLPEICIWPIKKRYDVVDRLVQFYTIIPTRIISLFRVDDNLFAGIISSPFGSDEVEKMLSNRLSVMVNDEQKIVGYNGLLNRILGKKDNTELLEQHVSNVLRFDDNPFLKKENIAPSMKKPITVLSWFGEKEQLASSVNLSPSAKISEDRGEVTFNNSSGVDYAVMSMNEQVNVDAADVDIEIVCTLMDGLVLPNIVMRAMLYRKNSYIDDYGYSLAYSKENVFVFKRAGQAKMKLMLDERTKQEEVQILWCKRGWSHLFFINGRFMGKWVETNPFTLSSDNFVSVFLRPGEKSVLRSLTVRTEQPVMKTNSLPDNRLHASISSPEGVYHYNVTFEQKMVSTFNTTTYFLEDITKISNEVEKLKIEKNRLKQMLSPQIEMIGNSESVENVKRQIALLAKTDITVVLEGETGTGKEVAARLIHESSKRKHSPFIKIDCSTIPANLIESELFGHEKGAFTGAVSAREGRFESADGGTLFIDEICNLSLEVQAKMLQAIQDLKITRVGGTASIPIDIRIVAASNKPLKSMIENGTFRTDLYYRLNQYTLTLPPLRERGDDITLLSEYFIDEASQKLNKSVNSISSEALKVLKGHKWPGNVRELRNTFFRAVLMCEKNEISAEHIELTDLSIGSSIQPKKKRHKWQKAEILDAISKSGGNITSAAASLSISRVMLYRIVKKFGINPDELRIV